MTKRQRLLIFILGIFSLFLFAVLSYFVHKGFFKQIDFDLTVKLQDHIPRRFDNPFSVFSLLGSLEVTGVMFLFIVILGIRKVHRFLLLSLFPVFHIFELLGKVFIYHPGPPFMFLRYTFGFHFPTSYIQTNYSYPSGHVGRTIFLIGILFFLTYKSKLGFFKKLIFYSFLISISGAMIVSRIYLGEHWFSDTLGGFLLGISFSLLTMSLW